MRSKHGLHGMPFALPGRPHDGAKHASEQCCLNSTQSERSIILTTIVLIDRSLLRSPWIRFPRPVLELR